MNGFERVENPYIRAVGKIESISTDGIVTVKAKVDNVSTLLSRKCKNVQLEFVDDRRLSPQQRKMVWALIGEIADWQGQNKSQTMKDMVNEAMKLDFLVEELDEDPEKMFSLSDAPISVVCAYQKFLINFVLENDIPTKMPLINYADDIQAYVYSCTLNKRCVCCGQYADLHHVDRVGMGRSRDDIIHLGMEALPLCRIHHTEAHTMSDKEFFERYHIDSGVVIDKKICDIYGLNY